MVWSHFREVNFNLRIMDRMLGILKVKMSLEYPTFETAFESGLVRTAGRGGWPPLWTIVISKCCFI